jgi:ribosome biogenesis GTPase
MVTAMRARELGRRGVVVGDRVGIVGDISGGEGALARIIRIDKRTSVLRRSADDDTTVEGRQERVIVANAQQLVIVCSLADPPPRTGFIDRCLVAAYDADIEPLLCPRRLTWPGRRRARTTRSWICHMSSAGPTIAQLKEALHDRLSVFVGHSGVGKSTLVNRLIPDAARAVGMVSAIGKGRHTSTSVVALPLPGGGWIVDTPGVRSFGIAHVDPGNVLHGFPELVEASANCPPNCDHPGGGDCGLDRLVAAEAGRGAGLSFRRSRLGPAPPTPPSPTTASRTGPDRPRDGV